MCPSQVHLPSGRARPFRAQSVTCRTKSKKKSPSGMLITLSPILMKRLKPSCDFILSHPAIVRTRLAARVEDFITKARQEGGIYSADKDTPSSDTVLIPPPSYLVCLVREVDLVIYLGCLVLYSLHLHMVRWVPPLPPPGRPLQPLEAVHGYRVPPAVDELGQVLHQGLAAVEESRGNPHQLPAALLRGSQGVLGQLLHDLAVDLVTQDLLEWRH